MREDMSDWHLSTPVAFIIFNRPDTTAKVFDVIRQMQPPKMLVIADGPRVDKANEVDRCNAARRIIERIDWPCEVLTNYSEINMGCKCRVSSGLNWVFEQVDEAIVLEDDCLPHPTFFRFCEELLFKYRYDERIGIISGNNFQFGNNRTHHSYYFSHFPHIWGWATWRRVWRNYDVSMELWPTIRKEGWLHDILGNKAYATIWTKFFNSIYEAQLDTWDFQLTFACWLNNYLSIIPRANLVSNIGFGLNATHTKVINERSNLATEPMHFPLASPPYFITDATADDHTMTIVYNNHTLLERLINKIRNSIT